MLMAPVVTPTQLPAGIPTTKVFFRGAKDDFDNPGNLTAFGDWTDDPADLNGFNAVQVLFRMLSAPLPGGAAVQPTVREVEIPFEY